MPDPVTDLLSVLRRDDLRRLVDRLGLRVDDRRARAGLVAALAAHGAEPAALLETLETDELRASCVRLGLASSGRKADLVARLAVHARGAVAAPRRDVRVVAHREDAPARPEELDFTAIDFETADYGRDSACSVALVHVRGGRIVDQRVQLLRPPRRRFVFTYVHGLTWEDVKDAPSFAEAWPELERLTEGSRFLAAHNAAFDKSVLRACSAAAGLPMTPLPFHCTVKTARAAWDVFPTKLPDVCRRLGIPLDHHEALSDARACAQIVLEAGRAGYLVLA